MFVYFPETLSVESTDGLRVDLEPPPHPLETLFAAGFVRQEATIQIRRTPQDPAIIVPARMPILREGFYSDYGIHGLRCPHPTIKYRIGIEPGMSGGPLIRRTVVNGEQFWSVVGTNIASSTESGSDTAWLANHMIAYYTHDVALPNGSWIPFLEAVSRNVVKGINPRATMVRTYTDAQGVRRFEV